MHGHQPEFAGAASGIGDAPIFIIGQERQAVARLAGLLGSHPRLGLVPEGGLLADLADATLRNQDALAHYGFPEQYWLTTMAHFVDGVQREYLGRKGKVRWLDCPPWNRPSTALLDRLFPRAQVVHVTNARAPLGGVWPTAERAARRAGADLGAGRYFQVACEDVEADAGACLGRVLVFLGEDAGAQSVSAELLDLTAKPASAARRHDRDVAPKALRARRAPREETDSPESVLSERP